MLISQRLADTFPQTRLQSYYKYFKQNNKHHFFYLFP